MGGVLGLQGGVQVLDFTPPPLFHIGVVALAILLLWVGILLAKSGLAAPLWPVQI